MRTRDVVRHIPPFSKYVRYIETLEGTLSQAIKRVTTLEGALSQVVFSDVTSLVETDREDDDGVPIPSAALRFMVVGESDPDHFLYWGRRGAQLVTDLLARHGKGLEQVGKVLDLGCGCGRVIRHLRRCGAEELHGCDCNAKAIAWCRRFLDFATFDVNNLEPPLPYPDATFGLIYAYSIWTHLPERLQLRWMDEARRVLRPGGYFLLTVHGRRFIDAQGTTVRAAFDRGELVVTGETLAGSNSCAAFHPERYVREVLARGFEVVDVVVEGAEACGLQDVYLLRSPG
jgi:SAM-dependent methyltransferase